jgi:sugar-specific transcriptional regulator TrmB
VVTNDRLVKGLAALDLNEYEARVYLALLGTDAPTAYELGKRAGVPLSRCYEIARSLARKGLAMVQPGETPRYRAVAPAVALDAHRRELDELGRALADHAGRDDREPVWVVHGRLAALAAARQLAGTARASLIVRAPADLRAQLAPALDDARRRGVLVDERAAEVLLVVCDRAEALLGDDVRAESTIATFLRQPRVVSWLAGEATGASAEPAAEAAWIDWQSRKLRRLVAG